MALPNYPNNPSVNDTFVNGGVTFQWDGEKWKALSNANNSLTAQLADPDSTVLIGGVEASKLGKRYSDYVSVMDFGAKGDGVTDDTVAIQSAANLGVKVLIPSTDNFFLITDEITLPDNTTVIGDGWNSKIQQTTQNKSVFVMGERCHIEGVHPQLIDGDNTAFFSCFKAVNKVTGTITQCFAKSADRGGCGVYAAGCKQLTIKGNMFYGGKWDGSEPNAAATAADILFYSSSASARHIVEGNYCLSNNSQGIYVDTLGYDADVVIAHNVVITLDTTTCTEGGTWAEAATGGVRRHGIAVGYVNSSVAGTRCTVNNNLCKNTRWTGIYKQGIADGSVSITDNVCTYNGYEQNNTLSAGIYVNTSGNEKVSGNTIEAFQNAATQAAGSIVLNAPSVNTKPVLISDNKIENSASAGIYVTTQASNAVIEGNLIENIVTSGIQVVNTAGGGHLIKDNTVRKTSGIAPAIVLTKGSSTIPSRVVNNDIEGFDNTDTSTSNVGISTAGDTDGFFSIVGNTVKNFYRAYRSSSYWTGRAIDAVLKGNTFEDCEIGWDISATTNNVTVPVCDTTYSNVNTDVAGTLGGVAARDVKRLGDFLEWHTSTTPTAGSWVVGDRVRNDNPTIDANSMILTGWICTTSGAPATFTPVYQSTVSPSV